jgi:antitoxin (DNA-binding transcriptional repressor) of toxin-antitoxin stability system
LTVDGDPIAALVAVEKADLETLSLSTNPQFLALIERSRARQRAEGGISSEEMRRRLSQS